MRVTKEIGLPFDAYPPIALFLWIISTIHINCIVEWLNKHNPMVRENKPVAKIGAYAGGHTRPWEAIEFWPHWIFLIRLGSSQLQCEDQAQCELL